MQILMLNVNEAVLDKVVYFLKNLPKSDVEIIDSFDYLDARSEAKLKQASGDYKKGMHDNFVSLEEVKQLYLK